MRTTVTNVTSLYNVMTLNSGRRRAQRCGCFAVSRLGRLTSSDCTSLTCASAAQQWLQPSVSLHPEKTAAQGRE